MDGNMTHINSIYWQDARVKLTHCRNCFAIKNKKLHSTIAKSIQPKKTITKSTMYHLRIRPK